jgi:hypothetical protein
MRRDNLTIDEALRRELDRGMRIIAATKDAACNVCGQPRELRAGACFDCKDKVLTDMIEVWEIANPTHRWPYTWRGEPFEDVSDEQACAIVDAIDRRLGK